MVVMGGLITVTLNLCPVLSLDGAPDHPLPVARPQPDSLWEAGGDSDLRWRAVTGDEKAAWNVLVAELQTLVADPRSLQPVGDHQPWEDLADWPSIADDPQGQWSIRRPPEWPRMAVAVSLRAADPLICGWGMLRTTGDGEWSVSIVRGPFTEQSALTPER